MKNPTKYVTVDELEDARRRYRVDLEDYPSAGPNPNITGMRNLYWGKNAPLLKHGAYVYKVPQRIYDLF